MLNKTYLLTNSVNDSDLVATLDKATCEDKILVVYDKIPSVLIKKKELLGDAINILYFLDQCPMETTTGTIETFKKAFYSVYLQNYTKLCSYQDILAKRAI